DVPAIKHLVSEIVEPGGSARLLNSVPADQADDDEARNRGHDEPRAGRVTCGATVAVIELCLRGHERLSAGEDGGGIGLFPFKVSRRISGVPRCRSSSVPRFRLRRRWSILRWSLPVSPAGSWCCCSWSPSRSSRST